MQDTGYLVTMMTETNSGKMYTSIAKHYDKIYRQKNYQVEVDKIKRLIEKYKKSSGKELLDVACGTGNHLALLIDSFKCTGIDITREMLTVAKEKIPKATLLHGDMTNLDLEKEFDVIICMFSSIGYVKTKENLARTIKGFADHLKTGGIVIIHPWLTEEMLVNLGKPHMTVYDSEDLKIVRMNITEHTDNNIKFFFKV
jgi:ubiquinone/menaquinone biosynthesis C-methylase UbiE